MGLGGSTDPTTAIERANGNGNDGAGIYSTRSTRAIEWPIFGVLPRYLGDGSVCLISRGAISGYVFHYVGLGGVGGKFRIVQIRFLLRVT